MAATYDPTLPTAKDRVRHSLGDTDMTGALRTDEQILAMIAATSEAQATASLAEGLAAEYAQQPSSISVGGQSFSWSERVKFWSTLSSQIAAQLVITANPSSLFSLDPSRGDVITSEYVRDYWWTEG